MALAAPQCRAERAQTRQDIQVDVNAAKGCKAERKADPEAFATKQERGTS